MALPERDEAKVRIHLDLETETVKKLDAVVRESPFFEDRSSLMETLVFWMEGLHTELRHESALFSLRDMKARRFIMRESLTELPPRTRIHITIDRDALHFIDFILRRYGVTFSSRSEFVELICAYASDLNNTPDEKAHLLKRLEQVGHKHPTRMRKRRQS